MNNLPPGANFDQNAPYNEKDYGLPTNCPNCNTILKHFDEGSYHGIDWIALKCVSCDHIESTEPNIN